MGKALIIISMASVVAMAAIVLTSFDRWDEAQVQQDVLATKTAESRTSPATGNRNEAAYTADDPAFPEESQGTVDGLEGHQGQDSSPLP